MRLKRAVAGATAALVAALFAPSCGEEAGWRCCQTTSLTCVCSENRACDGDSVVETCGVEDLGGDEAYCCHHSNIDSCSCSEDASDIGGEPVCSREGDRLVSDCSIEPSENGGGGGS
jgi:hypothetical protein